jgi:isoleucyl-tRNA synthetase
MFDPVDPKASFPDLERAMVSYWKEEDIFKRSIHHRSKPHGDPLNGTTKPTAEDTFSFYDGPPFATGLPHYGHLLAGTIKDVIPRYQTMRGKRVERRFGWDCHGLPVENEIEKEHGLKNKRDIEAMGVKAFNDLCRGIVQRYSKEWRTTVERMGRFVDMDHDYKTMDPDYMESIFWVFSELHKKGLIYEGYKPMHICPRCATPLANFEVTQGYKDRTDQSVIMTFPLKEDPNTVLLAWTTTPWSLPGNMWLAVGMHVTYVKVLSEGTTYILAKKISGESVWKKRA